MMLILTSDEMMQKGLQLLGFHLRRQQKVGTKKNRRRHNLSRQPALPFERKSNKTKERPVSRVLYLLMIASSSPRTHMTIAVHKCGMGPKLSSSSARTWPTGSTTTAWNPRICAAHETSTRSIKSFPLKKGVVPSTATIARSSQKKADKIVLLVVGRGIINQSTLTVFYLVL